MIEALLWFSAGLGMLILGADSFLKGASGLALRLGISPFVVGLTIVGFGTSAPELAVNLSAVGKGSYDLALGNVVGSNISNVGLILGLSALIAPLAVHLRLIKVEGPLMVAAALLLWLLALDGQIGRIDAAILLTGFTGVMGYVAMSARREPKSVKAEFSEFAMTQPDTGRNVFRLVIGLALLVYGAQQMVDSAITLARLWGWSELLIGLTIVAIGTSLPELASSILAVMRGQTDIAVGNVVGSNLFNILLIIGGTAAIHPLPVSVGMRQVELPLMLLFMAAGYIAMGRKQLITRGEGALLLGAFIAYLGWQGVQAMG